MVFSFLIIIYNILTSLINVLSLSFMWYTLELRTYIYTNSKLNKKKKILILNYFLYFQIAFFIFYLFLSNYFILSELLWILILAKYCEKRWEKSISIQDKITYFKMFWALTFIRRVKRTKIKRTKIKIQSLVLNNVYIMQCVIEFHFIIIIIIINVIQWKESN